jgi:GTP pyrophosphokinase
VRVLVDNVSDCYAALGIVHGLWPYIEEEFDDYIATPKGNLYRSIHTAVYGPGHQPLEVQIRTREMHEHAELGVAAHWKYKEGGSRDAAYEAKINSVRRLLKPTATDGESDFIDRVSGELFEDRIYVMTPKGEVIDLPKGATPLDFAYHVHTDLGHRSRGAKADGRIVPLTHPLNNGEVVEILTGKLAQPNRDWMSLALGFLASTRSRNKVRAYFRKLDDAQDKPASTAAPTPARVIPPPKPRRATAASTPTGVVIEGVNDLPSNLARCCNPSPPDAIVGYITLTRGMSIHRQNCPSLLRMKSLRPDRLFNVEWGAQPKAATRR